MGKTLLENTDSCICKSCGDHQRATCKSSHWSRTPCIWISPRKSHSSLRFSLALHHPPGSWTSVLPQTQYTLMYTKCWAVESALCVERSGSSPLYLFCIGINDENCVQTSFSCSWGNPDISLQPFWIWQIKRFNPTQGSTNGEKVGAYLQDVRS